MRIGIDYSVTRINQAGLAFYTLNLVEGLREAISDEDKLFLFSIAQQCDMAARKTIRSRAESLYYALVWHQLVLPMHARRARVHVLHMPANVMPLFTPCPTVVTIHDLVPLNRPRYVTLWGSLFSHVFMPLTARRSTYILTVSEYSKAEIIGRFGVIPDKVFVTYEAAAPQFRLLPQKEIEQVKQRYGIEGAFILAVGTIEPRKNLTRLFQALALLRQKGLSYQLIHAGSRGWLFEPILREVENLGLEKCVRFLGRVPLDDLVGLYNAASVFAYPSLCEGFGLPVLEAMACGCPVVTSNISSLPEVGGEAAIKVDPYNVQQLAEALHRVLEDVDLARDMREQGLIRARQFSWQRCAQETLAVYRRCLGDGASSA